MSRDEYLDEDEEQAPRSILASGWFRAVLAVGVLVVVLAVSLPYVLKWFGSGSPTPSRQVARPAEPRPSPVTPSSAPAVAATPSPLAPAPMSPAPSPEKIESVQPPAAAPVPTAPSPSAETPSTAPVAPRAATAKLAARGTAPERARAIDAARPGRPRTASPGGEYWVQVGAFQDERNAERLAATLREQKLPAEVTRVGRGAIELPRHEVFVSGATRDVVNTALRGSGTARVVSGGVAVQPPLDLKEAVALSRRLTADGLSVKIRRVSEAGGTLHVVRVGGYPSRPRAETAREELARTGLGGFIAQGPAR